MLRVHTQLYTKQQPPVRCVRVRVCNVCNMRTSCAAASCALTAFAASTCFCMRRSAATASASVACQAKQTTEPQQRQQQHGEIHYAARQVQFASDSSSHSKSQRSRRMAGALMGLGSAWIDWHCWV